MYISAVSMAITLFALGGFFYAKSLGMNVDSIGWLPLVSLIVYVVGFSLGLGPIPWLMMGEILPAKIRGSAASIATAFNWSCTFIVTKTFEDVIELIGAHGTFWLFGVIVAVGFVFVIICVPETRGRSLEEIEKRFTGKTRRMSSVANLKPMPMSCQPRQVKKSRQTSLLVPLKTSGFVDAKEISYDVLPRGRSLPKDIRFPLKGSPRFSKIRFFSSVQRGGRICSLPLGSFYLALTFEIFGSFLRGLSIATNLGKREEIVDKKKQEEKHEYAGTRIDKAFFS